MITIREMRPEDLDEVTLIEAKNFTQPWSRRGFETSLQDDNTIYLTALMDGVVAGYCGCTYALDEAEITNVAVEEEYRGKGMGYLLVTELVKRCSKKSIHHILLEVRNSNQPAIRLYQKAGFAAESVRKNFYEQPKEDAIVMWYHMISPDSECFRI